MYVELDFSIPLIPLFLTNVPIRPGLRPLSHHWGHRWCPRQACAPRRIPLHLLRRVEGGQADEAVRIDPAALSNFVKGLARVNAVQHGQFSRSPVTVVIVTNSGVDDMGRVVVGQEAAVRRRELQARRPGLVDHAIHLLANLRIGQRRQLQEYTLYPKPFRCTLVRWSKMALPNVNLNRNIPYGHE